MQDDLNKHQIVELYHDGLITYYYDVLENQYYSQKYNSLRYRDKSRKLLSRSSSISVAMGLLAVVFNNWYSLHSSVSLDYIMFGLAILTYLILSKTLGRTIKHHQLSITSPVQRETLTAVEVENIVSKASQLLHNLIVIVAFFFGTALLGLILFFSLSLLIGLVVFVFGLLASVSILKYLDIYNRYKVLKKLTISS